MSLTNLDKFEKIGQLFYATSLLIAPAWWISDNFADQSTPSSRELHLCNVLGMLCGVITAMTYWGRTVNVTKSDLQRFDHISSAAWGASGLLTLTSASLYKADKLVVNLGLQFGLAGAYVWQGMSRKKQE